MEWKSNPFFKSTFSPDRQGSVGKKQGTSNIEPSSLPDNKDIFSGLSSSPQPHGNTRRTNPAYEPWLNTGEVQTPLGDSENADDRYLQNSQGFRGGENQDNTSYVSEGRRAHLDGMDKGEHHSSVAAAAIGSDRPEEERFEQLVRRMVTREISVSDGIKAFREICYLRANALRELAASQVQQTPQYHALMCSAEELEREGCTWSLIWHLFAIDDASYPAGKGGDFVHGAGMYKTMRQHAADAVFQDPELNRAARVIAWLEAEKRREDLEPEQGMGRKDGLWRETKAVLDGTASSRFGQHDTGSATVKALDPDAMMREQGRINLDNAKDEERLSKVLWRLLRSGRLHQAALVCQYAGQPWRAASLTGYGAYGPLPLGEAADEADANETGMSQSETLAGEIELGASTKMLWRWACHAAARKIADSVEHAGHGRYESAVYAILSGDIEKAIQACSSWEDVLWVHLRCWLEYQIDLSLQEKSATALGAVHGTMDSEKKNNTWDFKEQNVQTLKDSGASIPSSQWPIDAVSRQIAQDLPSAVAQGSTGYGGTGTVDTANNFRKIQVNLMLGTVDTLLEDLIQSIVPGGSTEEAQNCPPGLMRFSAHLSLLLWSLNLVELQGDGMSPLYTKLNDGLQKLVWIYTVHLIDSASYSLVPTYLVHLRLGLRRTTTQLLLEQATYHETITKRRKLFTLCHQWFDRYADVEGFAQDEIWVSVSKFSIKAQETSLGGPRARAESVSWLFFGDNYIDDAVQSSVIVCRDFALGGMQGAISALHLLKEVIPEAAGCSDGLSTLISRGVVSQEMRELASWEKYFEIVREYSLWEEVYARAVEQLLDDGDDESGQQTLRGLVDDTKYLFDGIVEFILIEGGDWMVNSRSTLGSHEATLVLMPAEDNPLAANPDTYPVFPDDIIQQICDSIEEFTGSRIQEKLSFETGKMGVDMPGLVYIKIWADGPEKDIFEDSVTNIFCNILKSGIAIGNETMKFLAANILGPISISSRVCQAICLPQLILRVAALREALAYMGVGSSMEDASAILERGKQGWNGLFSEAQIEELSSLEISGTAMLADGQEYTAQ